MTALKLVLTALARCIKIWKKKNPHVFCVESYALVFQNTKKDKNSIIDVFGVAVLVVDRRKY